MNKSVLSLVLAAALISGLVLVSAVPVSFAQQGLVVIIGSDTTWTKANSPVVFSGPYFVSAGVTLTMDAGVTVNINGYSFTINGTLRALGSASDKIQISGGDITFGGVNQAGFSSTFQNAVINSRISTSKPLTFNGNTINGSITAYGVDGITFSGNILNGEILAGNAVNISNNNITGGIDVDDFCTIFNNTIVGDTYTGNSARVSYNNMRAYRLSTNPSTALSVSNSSEVSNNTITGDVSATSSTISNNVISGGFPTTDWSMVRGSDPTSAVTVYGNSSVVSNVISSTQGYGLMIRSGYTYVLNNTISRGVRVAGDTLIDGNSITDGNTGIRVGEIYVSYFNDIDYGHGNAIIRNNIITGNSIGIGSTQGGGAATIERNLISNNSVGVNVGSQMTIQNNTITNSSTAIYLNGMTVTITYNNIVNSSQYSLYLSSVTTAVNATYNWWGTTNTQAFNFTIRDSKYDLNLGTVSFTPFMNAQNPAALPVGTSPPVIPEFTPLVFLSLLITVTLIVSVGFKRKLEAKPEANLP